MKYQRQSRNSQQKPPFPKRKFLSAKGLDQPGDFCDQYLKKDSQEKCQDHKWILQMVHPQYRLFAVPHSPGMKKLGYSQNRKGIGLASYIKGIEGNAPYKNSVKDRKDPSSVGKDPFSGISGFFAHKGFGIIFIYSQSQCGKGICDQIYPQDMTGL